MKCTKCGAEPVRPTHQCQQTPHRSGSNQSPCPTCGKSDALVFDATGYRSARCTRCEPAEETPQGDELHTGDDDLLDTLTSIRVGLEEVLADGEPLMEDYREACETALEELTKADEIRVAELRAGSPETPRWQPIADGKDGTLRIVALIRNGVVWWVSDAAFNGLGWYTKNGEACHWATHQMPLPSPPEGAR